ncbi:MAG: type IV pilin-like G/H family protein [Synechococcales bacterium]|nr:type IV pilin-like G/H family protein [Synechococcales bacterium]
MKSELKAKFLQHLVNKRKEEGFTLIELLVVIIIIGILSAIALPSFLNQANKARESEAKQYVGSANRAHQAYYLERQTFTSDFALLGLGLNTDTANYSYTLSAADATAMKTLATPKNTNTLRAFIGGVDLGQTVGTNETTTRAILCQSIKPSTVTAAAVTLSGGTAEPACATGTFEEIQ